MSPAWRRACLAGYALATFFSFPQPVAGRVLDLGLVLAPVAPLLLLLGLEGRAPRQAAGAGLLAGLLAHAAVLHWIYVVTVHYGHGVPPIGVAAVLLLASYVAGFVALFAALTAWLGERDAASPWLLAALWTALEHGRSFVLTGFPWASLGYAAHANPALLGLAPYTGVYGLSFAVFLAGAGAAELARGRRRRGVAALLAFLLLHGLGAGLAASHAPFDGPGAQRVRVAVLQGNIDQGVKWSPDWSARTLGIYTELSRRAAEAGAEIVVWPETAVPGSPEAQPELGRALADLARETGSVLVVGAMGVDHFDRRSGQALQHRRFYDSAFVVAADGSFQDRYDKTHLVPFGEYLPFRPLLGRFVKALATGVASGDVTPGAAPRALVLPLAGRGETVTGGVPICYELIFPDRVRRIVGDGAQLLLAITNDAWYGRTGAPYQFLAMTALRSAETRVWTARAANTGVSAFIDERGRPRGQTAIFERDLRVADVPLRPPGEANTFYVRHGDVFAKACWLGSCAGLLGAGWRSRAVASSGAARERG